MKRLLFFSSILFIANLLFGQTTKSLISITGSAGIYYEGYSLSVNPETPSFYNARRPAHLVRFLFQPTIQVGGIKLPFNLNFSPMRNNFGAPPFGFGNLPGFPKQSFKQWITNPMNQIGINPTYKWAELQLGTQYQKYSELSTGDIGALGYGFSLKPGKFRIKFFKGISQQAYEPYIGLTTQTTFAGVYKRSVTMAQIGLEREGKYFAGFNMLKSKDDPGSITNPLSGVPATPNPAENWVITFASRFNTDNGWYGKSEIGTTITTLDANSLISNPLLKDFKPYIKTNLSSFRDHAAIAGFGKKGKGWDLGINTKWLGAGYYSSGYPFVQNDRLDYTINTRFNMWKKKINVMANVGRRIGNLSDKNNRTRQIIANINVFAQVNEHLSLNTSYNNFGFQTSGMQGIKNIGNDFAFSPSYVWNNSKSSHLISLNYNWSQYDESDYQNLNVISNNSQTLLLMYVPLFFSLPQLNTDAGIMYFKNKTTSIMNTIKIISLSLSGGWNFEKQKITTRSQLQYNITTIEPYSANRNLLWTLTGNYSINSKLKWNASATINIFKYGNELSTQPPLMGAEYFENTFKTSVIYSFGK